MTDTNSYATSLVPRIKAILSSSDLSTVSAKGVRKQLVSQGEDEARIKAARSVIDAHISEIYDQLASANPPSPPSSDDVPLTGTGASHSSPAHAYARVKAEPNTGTLPSVQARVKNEREGDIKPSVSASASSSRLPRTEAAAVVAETDEQMARRLQLEFDGTSRPRRAGVPTPKTKKRKALKKKVSRADAGSESESGAERKKKRAAPDNNFNKELILSDALAALVDAPRLSRPQTVKKIWEYVKERGLQDQSDKRYILCDEKLYNVFRTDRLHMFTMNKLLVDHVRNPDDIIVKPDYDVKDE